MSLEGNAGLNRVSARGREYKLICFCARIISGDLFLPFADCDPKTLRNDDSFSYRLCDGVIDCSELQDELDCPYCTGNDALHCGLSKQCIFRESRCNDVADCPNADDEKNCRKC